MARRRRIYFSSQSSHDDEKKIPKLDSRRVQSFQNEERMQFEDDDELFQQYGDDRGVDREDQIEHHSRLETCLTNLINSRGMSELVGVFGMNSDNIVYETIENMHNRKSEFMGYIDMKVFGEDVYNGIASCLLKKMQEYCRENNYFSSPTREERERIYSLLSDTFQRGSREDYLIENPLLKLRRLEERQQRHKVLIEAIKMFRQTFYNTNKKFIFVISVNTQFINYQMIQMLSKILDSGIIIIIQSLLDFEVQVRAFGNEIGYGSGDTSLFFKYFNSQNIFS